MANSPKAEKSKIKVRGINAFTLWYGLVLWPIHVCIVRNIALSFSKLLDNSILVRFPKASVLLIWNLLNK